MKRKLKLTAVVLAILLVGMATAAVLWPPDCITAESWERIRMRMREQEVEEILGRSGIYPKDAHEQVERLKTRIGNPPFLLGEEIQMEPEVKLPFIKELTKVWVGRRGHTHIRFDLEGQVTGKFFYGWPSSNLTDRLRDWLGW